MDDDEEKEKKNEKKMKEEWRKMEGERTKADRLAVITFCGAGPNKHGEREDFQARREGEICKR